MDKERESGFLKLKTGNRIEISFSSCESVEARVLGDVILSLQGCVKEAAKVLKYKDFKILIKLEFSKDLKILLKITNLSAQKRNILVRNLFDAIRTVKSFGANRVFNLEKEVVSEITNPEVLALCSNWKFLEDIKNTTSLLCLDSEKVTFSFGNREVSVNKAKQAYFSQKIKTKRILPEMENGETVELTGEITRINKEYNDIGLRIRNRILRCLLPDKEKEIAQFHNYINESEVLLRGMVERKSYQETPKIKIISIEKIETKEQLQLMF